MGMITRVVVTGDREWSDGELLERALNMVLTEVQQMVLIEGEAPGADTMAREWAEDQHVDVDPYPAEWSVGPDTPSWAVRRRRDGTTYDVRAGGIRNQRMIDEGLPHRAVCFHRDLRRSKGTKDMVKRLESASIPILFVPFDTRKTQMELI